MFRGIDLGYICVGPPVMLGTAVLLSILLGKRTKPPWAGRVLGFFVGMFLGGYAFRLVRYIYFEIVSRADLRKVGISAPPIHVADVFALFSLSDVFSMVVFVAFVVGVYCCAHYTGLQNATGATRGLEHGPQWQLAEYVKRRPDRVHSRHRWIRRLRAASWGSVAGSVVAFVVGGILGSFCSALLAWAIFASFVFMPYALSGVDALVLDAAVFPDKLLLGKPEFVIGRKARVRGYLRIITASIMAMFGLLSLIVWIVSVLRLTRW
jgi:hypothetical protein